MTRHENKTLESQHLVLDEGLFINCTFKSCSLECPSSDVPPGTVRGRSSDNSGDREAG